MDAGDQPFVAGCHFRYADAACSKGKVFHQGDGCLTGRVLFEWTDNKCHGPKDDVRYYDCDKLCREEKGTPAGFCQPVKNACGPKQPSARCRCN